ncbi:MAG: PKD domain-containing protein, partial [Dehalococcoidales bacterium]
LTYSWDLDNNGTFETPEQSVTFSAAGRDGSSSQTVVLQVCDDDGACATSAAIVNITNVAPALGGVSGPSDPVQVNTTVNVDADFTDPGLPDRHTAVWDWGDGNTSAGIISESDGSGNATDSHIYTTAGVYTVTLTVTDDDLDSSQSVYQYIVVYDPEGGFVTGNGWIESPKGAYAADSSLTGKATFGFVSRYKKGASIPTGQTQFQFRIANLNFHSGSYQWLVIAGSRAQFKGEGTISGEGNYGFMLVATDGEVNGGGGIDKFRIKIWDKNNGDVIVYDNKPGESDDSNETTELGGGGIVIHSK